MQDKDLLDCLDGNIQYLTDRWFAFILVGMSAIYQPGRTRQRILDAAFQQIYKNGFRATSLNQILADTGLTKGALYHHFPNKQALGHAVIDEVFPHAVTQVFLTPLSDFENPVDGLLTVIGQAFDGLGEDEICSGCPVNNLAQEMAPVDETFRTRLEAIYAHWSDGFAKALQQGQIDGYVSKEVDVGDAGSFIVAALAGCRSIAKSTQSRERMMACKRGLELYISGLKP